MDDDVTLEPFPFKGRDGKSYKLPDVRSLSPRQMQAASRGDLDALEESLAAVGADKASLDAFMDLPLYKLNSVIDEWITAGGQEGKSSAPSPSSSSTATRSKQTSKSGGSRSRR